MLINLDSHIYEDKILKSDSLNYSYLLTTGFNLTNLRAVFPCFDQPEFRSTFNFTVFHSEDYSMVTNSEEVTKEGPM